MAEYETRNWKIIELSGEAREAIPTAVAPQDEFVCGLGSDYGDRLEKSGSPVFYFDLEQLEAGIEESYGMGQLLVLTEDYTLPGGFEAKAGALVAPIHRMLKGDSGELIFTVMVEDLK